ncbi:glycine cleavage system protein T [Oscillochloris sp. ZM17-4]|uniref:CAF17-like 4Fe-4S cluster assembly/insertion protein YgfZ n=1 Tax=Oscillochloris sp. ZM17-4 TaxID=2866714 RepID=UPI001C737883|nr:glycine cleavage system protein T [Oscillochloris sp. ZM17-4]MBX0327802.1 glycine cleavage system protein T [Oscillochloris sp. ZM17-4]
MTDTLTAPQADLAAYAAAHEGAAIYDARAGGRIWMRDRDAAALLHRLSTNQIEKLTPGQGARAVLTTPIGRIIDLLTVHRVEDGMLLVTSPGQGPAIMRYLRKNIFFNDKVRLEDAGESLLQLAIYGPRAVELLESLGLPAAGLPPYGIAAAQWREWALYVARCQPLGAGGMAIYAPPEAADALADALTSAGAATLDADTFDVLRVEAGQGAFGRELSQEYIPLETGLWDAISFSKGCYVGQEIIARMESRGRLAKQLRGLRFPAGLPDGLALPAKLDAGGKEAGDLTSVAESPRHGLIGLAYVRSAFADPGGMLALAGVGVEVVGLPFV